MTTATTMLTNVDPTRLTAPDRSDAARGFGVPLSFAELSELNAALEASRTDVEAAWHQVGQLVEANRELEHQARALAEELVDARRLALHDPLTGLPNRTLFADRLDLAILQAHREDSQIAVLLLDLDRFKAINDGYGHAAGDEVLRETARRALASIRACDTACRLGGDEFVVLLSDIGIREHAEAVAEKIRSEIAKPLLFAEHALVVTASIGMSFYPVDGRTGDALIERADHAMYGRKARRKTAEATRVRQPRAYR